MVPVPSVPGPGLPSPWAHSLPGVCEVRPWCHQPGEASGELRGASSEVAHGAHSLFHLFTYFSLNVLGRHRLGRSDRLQAWVSMAPDLYVELRACISCRCRRRSDIIGFLAFPDGLTSLSIMFSGPSCGREWRCSTPSQLSSPCALDHVFSLPSCGGTPCPCLGCRDNAAVNTEVPVSLHISGFGE